MINVCINVWMFIVNINIDIYYCHYHYVYCVLLWDIEYKYDYYDLYYQITKTIW